MKSTTTTNSAANISESDDLSQLLDLWQRLDTKGLFQKEAGSLSSRLPGQATDSFLLMNREKDSEAAWQKGKYAIHISAGSARGDGITPERQALIRFHASIYATRPDIGAIAYFQPPWASLLHKLKVPLPLVFDEQCRQLGAPVVQIQKADDGSVVPNAILLGGANAFLDGERVVITSVTREKAIYNCELIEKCSKAYMLAFLTGGKIRRIPWLIRWIAKNRLRKDERRAATAYACGEIPTGFTAY